MSATDDKSAFSVCECGHAVIDHRKEKDHDECTVGECECDRIIPIAVTTADDKQEWEAHGLYVCRGGNYSGGVESVIGIARSEQDSKSICDANNAALKSEREKREQQGKAYERLKRDHKKQIDKYLHSLETLSEQLDAEREKQRQADWDELAKLENRLLSALAAIAEHNKKCRACQKFPITVDLSALERHDAEVRKQERDKIFCPDFETAARMVAAHIHERGKHYIEIAVDPKTKEVAWTFEPTVADAKTDRA